MIYQTNRIHTNPSRPHFSAARRGLAIAACLFTFTAHAQTLSFSTDVDTTSAAQSGGVVIPASIPNQTDYDTFSGASIAGPSARMYSITSNTCVGQISGPFVCQINVVFAPTFVPPSGQTLNATLSFSYQACTPGPTDCNPMTVNYSLVGTVTGTAAMPPPSAQIQITPTQPVLVQPGNYGPDLAFDNSGNLYASPSNTVVEFTPTQAYTPNSSPTIIAGSGGPGGTGDGGGPLNAGIQPYGITVLGGFIYVVDTSSAVVREFIPGGQITLYAGIYNSACRGIDQTYTVGLTTQGIGCYNFTSGPPETFGLFNPTSLTNDGLNIYINDAGSDTITLVTPEHKFTTVAGHADLPFMYEGYPTNFLYPGYTGDGGPGSSAQINNPGNMVVGGSSLIYFPDSNNNVIRTIDQAKSINTFLGQGPGNNGSYPVGLGDGPAAQATLSDPVALALDQLGDMYIFDQAGYTLRKVLIDQSTGNPTYINTLYALPHSGLPPVTVDIGTPVIDSTGELLFSSYFNLPYGTYSFPTPPPGIYQLLGSGLLTFPTVEVGTPTSLTATITNPGTQNLIISGASISGTNSGDFNISSPACSTVNPGNNCTITVVFNPTSAYTTTTRTATLYLSTNVGSGSQIIALTGTTYTQPTLTAARIYVPYYNWPEPSTPVASVVASGGVPPYTFTYSIPSSSGDWYLANGTTTAQIDGAPTQVSAIAYTITVTDSEGGTATYGNSFTPPQWPSSLQLSSSPYQFPTYTAVSVSGFMNPGEQFNAGAVGATGYVYMSLDGGLQQPFAINSNGSVQQNQFNIDILYHALTVNYGGDTNYTALSSPQTLMFNGNRPQSITFHGGLTAPSGDLISLTAHASSGLPVRYTVTSGPGNLDYTGVRLLFNGIGTVQVTASQAGNPSFAAATPVTAMFTSY